MLNYIVRNKDGLLVHSKMETTSAVLRKMSNGEGFVVYQTYVVNRNQLWGRLSNNPGDVAQEYTCLSIANHTFAVLETNQDPNLVHINPLWVEDVDNQLRSRGIQINFPPFI